MILACKALPTVFSTLCPPHNPMLAAVDIPLYSFAGAYVLVLLAIAVMKICKVGYGALLMWASTRMSIQLVLTGFVLSYLFKQGNSAQTLIFVALMATYAMSKVMKRAQGFPSAFRWRVSSSFIITSLLMAFILVVFITRQNFFNAQYTIPLLGMIIGNSMTASTLALKSYREHLIAEQNRMECLGMLGIHPDIILRPLLRSSVESALLPTINSMLGMGIIFLPGMMTGQILSGAAPQTAVMYQIVIMLAICATVSMSTFIGLYFSQRTLYCHRTLLITNFEKL